MLAKLLCLAACGLAGTAYDGRAHAPAGTASAPLGGYRVSNVHYDLLGTGIARIGFSLDAPATRVQASLGDGRWIACAPTGASTYACVPAAPVPVAAATELSVTAVG